MSNLNIGSQQIVTSKQQTNDYTTSIFELTKSLSQNQNKQSKRKISFAFKTIIFYKLKLFYS